MALLAKLQSLQNKTHYFNQSDLQIKVAYKISSLEITDNKYDSTKKGIVATLLLDSQNKAMFYLPNRYTDPANESFLNQQDIDGMNSYIKSDLLYIVHKGFLSRSADIVIVTETERLKDSYPVSAGARTTSPQRPAPKRSSTSSADGSEDSPAKKSKSFS